MRRWLFCFQKSVALVLSKLLLSSSHSFPSTKAAVAQYNQNQVIESQQTSYQMQYTGSTGVGIGYGLNQSDSGSNNGGIGGSSKFGLGSGINAAFKVSKDRLYNTDDLIDNYGTNRHDGEFGEDKKIWLAELGNGHGKHSALAKRRITFSDGVSQSLNPSRSNSMFLQDDSEDNDRKNNYYNPLPTTIPEVPSESMRRSVWDRSYAERSVVDLTRMSLDGPRTNSDSGGDTRNSKMTGNIDGNTNLSDINNNLSRNKSLGNNTALQMGKSPMIPITDFNMGSSFFDAKLAGSYSDSMDRERVMVGLSLSPPDMSRFRSMSEESRCSDQSTLFANDFGNDSGRDSPVSDG